MKTFSNQVKCQPTYAELSSKLSPKAKEYLEWEEQMQAVSIKFHQNCLFQGKFVCAEKTR